MEPHAVEPPATGGRCRCKCNEWAAPLEDVWMRTVACMDSPQTESMIRYECDVCDVGATCVVTEASARAWLDHMETHGLDATYSAWVWEVHQLWGPIDFERVLPMNVHVLKDQ